MSIELVASERFIPSPLLDLICSQSRSKEIFDKLECAVFNPFWNLGEIFVQAKFDGFTGSGKSRLIKELLDNRWQLILREVAGRGAILVYHNYEKSMLVARKEGLITSKNGEITNPEYQATDKINDEFKGLARQCLRGRVLWVEERVGITQNVDNAGNSVGITRGNIVGDKIEIESGYPTVNFVLTADENLRKENIKKRLRQVARSGRVEDQVRTVGLKTLVQHLKDFYDAMEDLKQRHAIPEEYSRFDSSRELGNLGIFYDSHVVNLIRNVTVPQLGRFLYGQKWQDYMGVLYNPARLDRRKLRYSIEKLERKYLAYDLLERQAERTSRRELLAALERFKPMKYYESEEPVLA